MALIIERFFDKTQTFAVLGRSLYYNHPLMRYIIDRIVKEYGMGEALINSDRSKSFDKVDHLYLERLVSFLSSALDICLIQWRPLSNLCKWSSHNLTRSVHQGCTALVGSVHIASLLRKLVMLKCITWELWSRNSICLHRRYSFERQAYRTSGQDTKRIRRGHRSEKNRSSLMCIVTTLPSPNWKAFRFHLLLKKSVPIVKRWFAVNNL